MKNLQKLLLITAAFAFTLTACSKRYTQHSTEIDALKKVVTLYGDQKFDEMATFYADSAKIANNVPKKQSVTIAQRIAQNKEDSTFFSTWKIDTKEGEYEMVETDKGETWVNYWGQWQGTLKSNNKLYVVPVCITAKFIDGKIVREFGYWDDSKIALGLQKTEAVSSIDAPDQLKMATK